MSDMTLLRIGIAVAMTLLLGAIIFFGRGRRNERGHRPPRARDAERIEPDSSEMLDTRLPGGRAMIATPVSSRSSPVSSR